MPRFTHQPSGAIVSVSDEKAKRLGSDWTPADEKKTPAKKAASSKSEK